MTHTLPPAEPTAAHPKRPFFAHVLRILALPIILFFGVFLVAGILFGALLRTAIQ